MSDTYIDKLIKELCPEGVKHDTLDNLGETYSGLSGKTKADFSNGNARYISYKNIYNNLAIDLVCNDFVQVKLNEKQNALRLGDVLFTGSSETHNEVGMSSVVTEEPAEAIYLNSFCFGFRFNDNSLMLPSFSKYIFRSNEVRRQIVKSASGVTRINVSKKRFLRTRVPILPREIQNEIAKILDGFTALEAELKAELEARRQQYHYYRDALLTLGNASAASKQVLIGWKPLGEIGTFIRGRRFTKEDYASDGIPCIHYGDIYTQYGVTAKSTVSHVRSSMKPELKYAAPGDVVIAGVGETVEDVGKAVAWLGDGDVAIHDDCCALQHSQNPTYIAYCFQLSAFHAEKQKYVARGKVKRVGSKNLAKVSIPIPYPDDPRKSREEQDRIVAILDKFDALVNDLTDGIPAEIKARRKQYEYYRDQLLTFPQTEEAAE